MNLILICFFLALLDIYTTLKKLDSKANVSFFRIYIFNAHGITELDFTTVICARNHFSCACKTKNIIRGN